MRILILIVLLALLPSISFAQFKDEAILLIKFVGFEDESEKKILKSHCQLQTNVVQELLKILLTHHLNKSELRIQNQ